MKASTANLLLLFVWFDASSLPLLASCFVVPRIRTTTTTTAITTAPMRKIMAQQQKPQQKKKKLFLSSSSSYDCYYSSRRRLRVLLASSSDDNGGDISSVDEPTEDEEWYPRDPAYTTPQLLSGIWHQISEAGAMVKGETYTVIYPQMEDKLNTPRFMATLMNHLDVCKDVCDHFGISTTLVPHRQNGGMIVGFTSKSFRTNSKKNLGGEDGGGGEEDEEEEEMTFAYDPLWDDGTDFDNLYKNIDDDYEEEEDKNGISNKKKRMMYPEIKVPVPDDDDELIDVTKKWVSKMMSDMGICPFTQGSDKAGLPMGDVFYCVDRSTGVEDAYAKYWKEVVRVEQFKERDLSTTLLILPNFFMNNIEMFENFSNTLTQALTSLQVEELIQLVFFHPHWSFRDGGERSGAGEAANYARRSPWPMINLLRTNQVRAAQKGIPTGLVYKQNEKTLSSIGVQKLETMLRLRDWSDIADLKVNRRETDALKIAEDFQATGALKKEDISLEHDSTPAANKVGDRRQVEEGDLVTVVMQALDKRLGQSTDTITPLSGPETSASAMAADFLIQELDKLVDVASSAGSINVAEVKEQESMAETTTTTTAVSAQEAARQARFEAARRAMMADVEGETPASDRGDGLTDVLFGKGGIPDRSDEQFNEGLDPGSFY